MTLSEYLLNGLLVLVVVRQLRGKRLAGANLYVPLALVAYAAIRFLHTIPTAGNDLWLALTGAAAGLVLGTLCALYTRVYPDHDGVPFARATAAAAGLWIVGVGSRIAFSLYAQHGGGPSIVRFSEQHDITTAQAWVAALVLMALTEVVSRTAILVARGYGRGASSLV